jgi:NTP pyrophosphatase (non-canonical NTP hydrolase)
MGYPHYNVDLERTQNEIIEWSTRNFGRPVPLKYDLSSFLGMVEEIGEIAHAVLKASQGIRGTSEEHHEAVADGIADLLIYTLDFCARNGFSADDLLRQTWAKVQERDWKANPQDGKVNPA